MNARTEIVQLMRDNRSTLESNLNRFWRENAEDLVAAGFSKHEVVESMIVVAMAQCMKLAGATPTAAYLRRCADVFEHSAECGVEFPATAH
jgi:hypothetical protein